MINYEYFNYRLEGATGGFILVTRKGTNFAHIIEHVILELLFLSNSDNQLFKGWTRKKATNTYVIHYSAPNFLSGRLAAILGVDLVKRLINEEKINIDYYLDLLKNPIKYFIEKDKISAALPDLVEPIGTDNDRDGGRLPGSRGLVLGSRAHRAGHDCEGRVAGFHIGDGLALPPGFFALAGVGAAAAVFFA